MADDPITGAWTTGPIVLFLKYDGAGGLSGRVTAGGLKTVGKIQAGTFDTANGALRFEGDITDPRNGNVRRIRVDGTLSGDRLHITYRSADTSGSATLTRVTIRTVFDGLVNDVRNVVGSFVGLVLGPMIRAAHPRRTREQNEALMRERGENPTAFVIREVREDEIDALARLHVVTWAATYPEVLRPPTFAIRSWQWRDAFAKQDGNWFCYVVENAKGELVGFAKGVRNRDKPAESDLNKIYLLSEYQRLGLGHRMLAAVAERFLSLGVTRMTVHAEESNPSCRFYEATGAVNTIDEKTGRPNGGSYVWNDLAALKRQLTTATAHGH